MISGLHPFQLTLFNQTLPYYAQAIDNIEWQSLTMRDYDFNLPIDRRHGDSVKWQRYAGRDILPMWIADSDFSAPPAVLEALQQRVEHGVFGYAKTPDSLNQLLVERLAERYQWQVDPDWLVWLPGLVCGLNLACRSFAPSGSEVICPTPIYPPFVGAIKLAGQTAVQVPMVRDGQRWQLNIDALEQAITPNTQLLMLCNPHNPGGSVYRKQQLQDIAELAVRHQLTVCSDEIHCDLILDNRSKHLPIASINRQIASQTITLMAPSKTFNIAGLGCSVAIISDAKLRSQFRRARRGLVPDVNLLGYVATQAAYRYGEPWLEAQLEHLRGNHQQLLSRINAIDGLEMLPLEATYLAWIDTRKAQLEDPAAFFEAAGVGLSSGSDFGAPGFMRLNFACTEPLLDQALTRIELAFANR